MASHATRIINLETINIEKLNANCKPLYFESIKRTFEDHIVKVETPPNKGEVPILKPNSVYRPDELRRNDDYIRDDQSYKKASQLIKIHASFLSGDKNDY